MCRRLLHGVPEASSIRHQRSSHSLPKRRSVVKHEMGRMKSDPVNSHIEEHKPKRRTQLACTRCRQRKIKCSGESSEGLGCEKCREAKKEDCVFLRAGSTLLETSQSTRAYRTHHSMMSSSSSPATSTMVSSAYGNNNFAQSLPGAMPCCSSSASSMSPMLDTTRPQSVSDMGVYYNPVSPWTRGSVYHANSLIEDVYAAPYDSSSAAYVYPGSSSISYSGGYHGSSSSSIAWEPTVSQGGLQSAVLYSDADRTSSSPSMEQNLPASSDVPSLFPIVNLLSAVDGPVLSHTAEQLASNSNIASTMLGSSNITNDSELIGSGLPFMASEYLSYPMHTGLNSTASFRPKSSSTAAAVSPLTLNSNLSTSSFYVDVPYDSSATAASTSHVPMTSMYNHSDTVNETSPSEESLVMSMNASLKKSPCESGSYEYATAEQYNNGEVDNSSSGIMLEQHQQRQYAGYFKQSTNNNNNNNPGVEYNAFGFLQGFGGSECGEQS